jgi:hypothetical protein
MFPWRLFKTLAFQGAMFALFTWAMALAGGRVLDSVASATGLRVEYLTGQPIGIQSTAPSFSWVTFECSVFLY